MPSPQPSRAAVADSSAPVAEVHREGGTATMRLQGEIDVLTAPLFEQALNAARADGATRFVLDMQDVEFFDCSGAGVLARLREQGTDVSVVGARPIVATVLRLTSVGAPA